MRTPDDPATAPGDSRPRVVAIAGPTATGKTRLGIDLALRFGGEVVNADSRYLYRGLDIGVAKPTLAERRGVPHHLIDICDPAEEMSVALFQRLAGEAIVDIARRGRLPLLVGGTPQYLNAVIEGWRVPEVAPDWGYRAELELEAATRGLPALTARLAAVDPAAAAKSGQNQRRVIRALEIYRATGQPMTQLATKGPPPYHALELRLQMERKQLYQAIDARIQSQLDAGLVDEVRALLAAGIARDAPALSSLGYRQLFDYLDGLSTLAEAVTQIETGTHRYVRHQETWLRRNPRAIAIDVLEPGWQERVAGLVEAFLTVQP